MESIVKGKKLLILGGSTDELTIVERAQKLEEIKSEVFICYHSCKYNGFFC